LFISTFMATLVKMLMGNQTSFADVWAAVRGAGSVTLVTWALASRKASTFWATRAAATASGLSTLRISASGALCWAARRRYSAFTSRSEERRVGRGGSY